MGSLCLMPRVAALIHRALELLADQRNRPSETLELLAESPRAPYRELSMPFRSSTIALALTFASLALACSSKSSTTGDAGASVAALVAARPYVLVVPTSYDASKPTPLLIMMHGYGFDGAYEETYMGLTATAQAHGFLYAYGNGTVNPANGLRYWNATDACCDFVDNPVDDVAYIDAIRADVASKYNVDPKRFFLVGHSNGGFMAHRYSCDHAEQVAAIVSLAGAVWNDPSKCQPSEPVAIAEVHGDADDMIDYNGGTTMDQAGVVHTYPSAPTTVATWSVKDSCPSSPSDGGTITVDRVLPPGNTQIERYTSCAQTTDAELWTIHGGAHIPELTSSWGEQVWGFLSVHPKP